MVRRNPHVFFSRALSRGAGLAAFSARNLPIAIRSYDVSSYFAEFGLGFFLIISGPLHQLLATSGYSRIIKKWIAELHGVVLSQIRMVLPLHPSPERTRYDCSFWTYATEE